MNENGVSNIGKNIARFRKEEGLSGSDLANLAGEGLSRSVIANLENGRKDDVTIRQLMALANALRVPPAILIADMFNPGELSPYPLPTRQIKELDVKTARTNSTTAKQHNRELLWYVQGVGHFHDVSFGAAKLSADMAEAYAGYTSAWVRFAELTSRFRELLDGAQPEYAGEETDFDISVALAALESLRWISRLRDLGVTIDRAETSCLLALRTNGLPSSKESLDAYVVARRAESDLKHG